MRCVGSFPKNPLVTSSDTFPLLNPPQILPISHPPDHLCWNWTAIHGFPGSWTTSGVKVPFHLKNRWTKVIPIGPAYIQKYLLRFGVLGMLLGSKYQTSEGLWMSRARLSGLRTSALQPLALANRVTLQKLKNMITIKKSQKNRDPKHIYCSHSMLTFWHIVHVQPESIWKPSISNISTNMISMFMTDNLRFPIANMNLQGKAPTGYK